MFGKLFARLVLLLVVVATVAGLAFAFLRYDDIAKWAYYRSYTPEPQIEALANKASLSEVGKDYFYFSDPKLKPKSEFNSVCQFPDRSMVLGCYTGADNRIYILDITAPKLEGVEVVTAAHEMLHAAYVDLSNDEKTRVDQLLRDAIKTIDDERIIEIYREYAKEDDEEAVNELHSILATEVSQLPSELDQYYEQYFNNRQDVVAIHQDYRDVFLAIETQVADKQAQLTTLEAQIKEHKETLEILGPTIDAQLTQVNEYADEGDAEQYYPALEKYRTLVADYNETVRLLNQAVANYNVLVDEINALALRQNDLVNELDSTYKAKDNNR